MRSRMFISAKKSQWRNHHHGGAQYVGATAGKCLEKNEEHGKVEAERWSGEKSKWRTECACYYASSSLTTRAPVTSGSVNRSSRPL